MSTPHEEIKVPQAFVRTMFAAAEVLGVDLTAERVGGYWALVGHLGEVVACRAVGGCLRESKFPRLPLPAEILERAGAEHGHVADEADATAVWAALVAVLQAPAAWAMTKADRRVELGVEACGGLYTLRTGSDGESMVWKQQKFVRAYMGAARAERRNRIDGGADGIAAIVAGVENQIRAAGAGAQIGGKIAADGEAAEQSVDD